MSIPVSMMSDLLRSLMVNLQRMAWSATRCCASSRSNAMGAQRTYAGPSLTGFARRRHYFRGLGLLFGSLTGGADGDELVKDIKPERRTQRCREGGQQP